jgi:hypothetical protein
MEQVIEEGNETTEIPVEEMQNAAMMEIAEDEALEEFKTQVNFLMDKIREDPEIRDRLICETYVNIANMETAIRSTFAMFQEQGIGSMFKAMLGRGKKE